MKEIRLAANLKIPESSVTTSFALLAMKGAGKSNAAVVFAEQLFAHGIPWVAIDPKGDWWGIRAGQHGLPVPIFGGLHADIPLDPTAGALIADLIVDKHLTALIDTSEFTKGESIRFLVAFFDRLYRRKNRATYPMHLFLEECDDYVPQKVYAEVSKLVRQVELVVKRGRSRGLGITLATQRAASVNKDVLTQTDVLIALRTTSPQDRKAIEAWLSWHASSHEIAAQLPTLQAGQAWVNWPERGLLEAVQFDRRTTFDSGATPELGERVKPATLADIDVAAITAAFAAQIEQAAADDPAALRARIRELERAAVENPRVTEKIVQQPVEFPMPFVPRETIDALEAALLAYDVSIEHLGLAREGITAALNAALAVKPAHFPPSRDKIREAAMNAAAAETTTLEFTGAGPKRVRRERGEPSAEDLRLKAGARRMLEALQTAGRPLTKAQLSVLAQVTKGGTFSDYLSSLRLGGYIVEDGDTVRVAPAHRAVGAGQGSLPGPEQIAEMYRPRLKAGARRMLEVLMTCHPYACTREELSEKAEVTKGGTFSDYLSSLTRIGLAETTGREVRAGAVLYIGG